MSLEINKNSASGSSASLSSKPKKVNKSSEVALSRLQPAKAIDDLDGFQLSKKVTPRPVLPPGRGSKEVGDIPTQHDGLFNFIPGVCFEITGSLYLLENPGLAGKYVDECAKSLALVIENVYKNGDRTVLHNGQLVPLKKLFDEKFLKHLHPDSTVIGRCLELPKDSSLKKEWYEGVGKNWLLYQLEKPSDRSQDPTNNMLTKISALAVLGDLMKDLGVQNDSAALLAPFFNKQANTIKERCSQAISKLRHPGFNNPQKRARSERRPEFLGSRSPSPISLVDGNAHGIGFGQVYADASFPPGCEQLKAEHNAELEKSGRAGMKRLGQAIDDHTRPGLLTEYALEHIPEQFKTENLLGKLQQKGFEHGKGVDRWLVTGQYARDSWDNDLPAAGAHSGTTADTFLAVNCLGEQPIFGNRDVAEAVGILISSFMNFGGYHSFVETFPIAQAVAEDKQFEVEVGPKQKNNLYADFADAVERFGGSKAKENMTRLKAVYDNRDPLEARIWKGWKG